MTSRQLQKAARAYMAEHGCNYTTALRAVTTNPTWAAAPAAPPFTFTGSRAGLPHPSGLGADTPAAVIAGTPRGGVDTLANRGFVEVITGRPGCGKTVLTTALIAQNVNAAGIEVVFDPFGTPDMSAFGKAERLGIDPDRVAFVTAGRDFHSSLLTDPDNAAYLLLEMIDDRGGDGEVAWETTSTISAWNAIDKGYAYDLTTVTGWLEAVQAGPKTPGTDQVVHALQLLTLHDGLFGVDENWPDLQPGSVLVVHVPDNANLFPWEPLLTSWCASLSKRIPGGTVTFRGWEDMHRWAARMSRSYGLGFRFEVPRPRPEHSTSDMWVGAPYDRSDVDVVAQFSPYDSLDLEAALHAPRPGTFVLYRGWADPVRVELGLSEEAASAFMLDL